MKKKKASLHRSMRKSMDRDRDDNNTTLKNILGFGKKLFDLQDPEPKPQC